MEIYFIFILFHKNMWVEQFIKKKIQIFFSTKKSIYSLFFLNILFCIQKKIVDWGAVLHTSFKVLRILTARVTVVAVSL